MLEIYSRQQLKELLRDNKIRSNIADMALADLIVFEMELNPSYYTEDTKPEVVVMDLDEFQAFKAAHKNIETSCPEYVDIVHADKDTTITKSLYLMENGESGVVVYTIISKGKSEEMFTGEHYITANAESRVGKETIAKILEIIEEARVETDHRLDYLQIFELTQQEGGLLIRHSQERPPHTKDHFFEGLRCESGKMYLISSNREDGSEYSTLMMAEDY